MSTTLLRHLIALFEIVKRRRLVGGRLSEGARQGQAEPSQLGRPRHRCSTFFELP